MNESEKWAKSNISDKYMVSSLGRVRNIRTGREKKISINKDGRKHFSFTKNDGSHGKAWLSKVVYEAFHGETEYRIAFIDGNISNCNLENLYETVRKKGGYNRDFGQAKLSSKQIEEIKKSNKTQVQIAKDFGVSQPYVSQLRSQK